MTTPRPIRHLRPEDLRGLRWRGYIRESTERQANRGTPPERQRQDILRAAGDLGLLPSEPLWYEHTGTGEARSDELYRALADARAGLFDVLLVFTTSRFARDRDEATTAKAAYRKAGIPIYFVADRIISGARTSALQEGISEVVDEHSNEERRFLIAGGMRTRQLDGRWVGVVPYGYRPHMADNPDGSRTWDGTLEPDPDEAPILRRIANLLLSDEPLRHVAGALNRDGARTRNGHPWSVTTIRHIATNPIYAGRALRYRHVVPARHYFPEGDEHDGRQTLPIRVEPLLSPDEQVQIAGLIARRASHLGGGPATRYPLSGVVRCGKCGYRMTGVYAAHGERRYYRCAGRQKAGVCDAPSAIADVIEQQFAEWLDGFRLRPDWRERIAKQNASIARSGEAERRSRLEGQMARYRDLYALGDMTRDEYLAKAAELKSELSLTVLPDPSRYTPIAEILTGEWGKMWLVDPGTAEQRNAVPNAILKDAVVTDRRVAKWVVRAEFRLLFEEATVRTARKQTAEVLYA